MKKSWMMHCPLGHGLKGPRSGKSGDWLRWHATSPLGCRQGGEEEEERMQPMVPRPLAFAPRHLRWWSKGVKK